MNFLHWMEPAFRAAGYIYYIRLFWSHLEMEPQNRVSFFSAIFSPGLPYSYSCFREYFLWATNAEVSIL